MNKKHLNNLHALGEGFTTEFKKSGASNLGREICAFANATGGVILIGVDDAGEIVGVKNHNRLKSEVQSAARSAEPPIAVEIESVGNVLCVTIPAQQSKPYSFGGKFFIREGASSQQMARNEIREFFYKEGLIHFDETPCKEYDLKSDLTSEVWRRFASRSHIPAEMDAIIALENLHLIKDNRMTRAGAWLLSADIRKYNIAATVTCALFRGTTKTHILDRKEFTRDLYSIYEDCMGYIQSKLNTALIPHAVGRDERLELPEDALREAVVNAIAHRDYRSTANVQIYIFHDRVEIVTPGGLPAGMREEDLGIKSVPRNPLLFGLFHRMNLVEQIGSGIRRIRRMCKDYGVAVPEIEVSDHWVTMTFKRAVTQPGTKPESSQHQDGTKSALSRHQVKILYKCVEAQPLTTLIKITGRSDRTKFRHQVLSPLLESELLEMTVPDQPRSRNQKYRLTNKGKALLENLERKI